MKFKLFLLFFLFTGMAHGGDTIYGSHSSGACTNPQIFLNGIVCVGSSSQYSHDTIFNEVVSERFWIGNIYVSSFLQVQNDEGDGGEYIANLACIIYMPPGDSVAIIDSPGLLNKIFYAPDTTYEFQIWFPHSPDGNTFENNFTIIVQYLSDTPTAIQNIQSSKQNIIYPNPTSGLLNFTNYYPTNGMAEVKIFDVSGAELIQQNFEVSPGLQSNPVDIGNLPNGVYLVQYTINGTRKMEKVVKM